MWDGEREREKVNQFPDYIRYLLEMEKREATNIAIHSPIGVFEKIIKTTDLLASKQKIEVKRNNNKISLLQELSRLLLSLSF